MDEKESKKQPPEGDELNPEELETVTGALFNIPGGGGNTGGNRGINYTSDSCKETSDTGIGGCPG